VLPQIGKDRVSSPPSLHTAVIHGKVEGRGKKKEEGRRWR